MLVLELVMMAHPRVPYRQKRERFDLRVVFELILESQLCYLTLLFLQIPQSIVQSLVVHRSYNTSPQDLHLRHRLMRPHALHVRKLLRRVLQRRQSLHRSPLVLPYPLTSIHQLHRVLD